MEKNTKVGIVVGSIFFIIAIGFYIIMTKTGEKQERNNQDKIEQAKIERQVEDEQMKVDREDRLTRKDIDEEVEKRLKEKEEEMESEKEEEITKTKKELEENYHKEVSEKVGQELQSTGKIKDIESTPKAVGSNETVGVIRTKILQVADTGYGSNVVLQGLEIILDNGDSMVVYVSSNVYNQFIENDKINIAYTEYENKRGTKFYKVDKISEYE